MAGSVVDNSSVWKRIKSEIMRAKGSYTQVGVQADEPMREDGLSQVLVAVANEFGVPGRIPERPFMRSAFDLNLEELLRFRAGLLDKVMRGQMGFDQALGLLGEFHQAKVQARIVEIDTPPNSPETIRRKQSSNPLIDTSSMLQSIRHAEVVKK